MNFIDKLVILLMEG